MDLRQLEAFVAVATLGSFKAAANRLSLTQPAISARISALEAEIGEELFRRDVRPVGLSDRAKRMLPYAEKMIELSQHIRPSTIRPHDKIVERLRIGTNSSLVRGWLPQLSWRLHQAIPNVIIDYEVGASHRLRDGMRSGALDVCLMHAPSDMPGIRRHHICDMRAIWAARPEVVPSRYLAVEEFAKRNVIIFGPESPSALIFESNMQRRGLWPVNHISTNYADIIVSHIKHADFVGMLLCDCIIHELNNGSIVEVKTDFELDLYALYACHSVTKSKSVVRQCVDIILDFSSTELPRIKNQVQPKLPASSTMATDGSVQTMR